MYLFILLLWAYNVGDVLKCTVLLNSVMYNMEGYCTNPYGNTKSVYIGQDATDGKPSTSFQYNTD